jgi:hypothetical protein
LLLTRRNMFWRGMIVDLKTRFIAELLYKSNLKLLNRT